MKANKTSILLILDRSGSMSSCHKDLVGGVNFFIEEQKKIEGECNVSVVGFDTVNEDVVWNVPISFVPEFTTTKDFVPRGGTALYDAIGYAVDKLGKDLAETPEEERPSKVIVVIYTDGEENSSRLLNSEQVKNKITHQQEKYAWEFVFLGANQDAILSASRIGISSNSSLTFSASALGNSYALSGVNCYITGMRVLGSGTFTPEQRTLSLAS
jgi:uncharacterized protein YegL